MLEGVKESKGEKIFNIVNIILLAVITFVMLYPLIFVVFASVSDPKLVYEHPLLTHPLGFTLDNYKDVYANKDIWLGYRNTIFYAVLYTVVSIALTIMAAYPLSKSDFYGRRFFTIFIVFTMFFSGGLIPSYLVNKKLGLVNSIWALILPGAISTYNVIITRTYFQTRIPKELEEAAEIDGCGILQTLFKIVLPLSTPIIAVMVLFNVVGQWNSYFTAMIYLDDRSKFPLQLFLREILIKNDVSKLMDGAVKMDRGAFESMMKRDGIKYAVVVVSSIPILILYPLLSKFFKEGIMVGSIKG